MTTADTARQTPDADCLAKWQAVNTALFWHIRPAPLIDGAKYRKDARKVASLINKRLANGRALLLWALHWTDASSRSAQLTLTDEDALPVDAMRVKLSIHMQDLAGSYR